MNEVNELRILIRKVLIPRIKQLEDEVSSLRNHTWPYVQSQKESHPLDDINAKVDFLKQLDNNTIIKLIRLKSKMSNNSDLSVLEYDIINGKL
jgi:hypothetical protein